MDWIVAALLYACDAGLCLLVITVPAACVAVAIAALTVPDVTAEIDRQVRAALERERER